MSYFRARLCKGKHGRRDVVAVADHEDPIALAQIMREAASHWKARSSLDSLAICMINRRPYYDYSANDMFLEFDYPEQVVIKIE